MTIESQVELMKIEQKERLLKAKYDLIKEEGLIREQLQKLENRRYELLSVCGGCSA